MNPESPQLDRDKTQQVLSSTTDLDALDAPQATDLKYYGQPNKASRSSDIPRNRNATQSGLWNSLVRRSKG